MTCNQFIRKARLQCQAYFHTWFGVERWLVLSLGNVGDWQLPRPCSDVSCRVSPGMHGMPVFAWGFGIRCDTVCCVRCPCSVTCLDWLLCACWNRSALTAGGDPLHFLCLIVIERRIGSKLYCIWLNNVRMSFTGFIVVRVWPVPCWIEHSLFLFFFP